MPSQVVYSNDYSGLNAIFMRMYFGYFASIIQHLLEHGMRVYLLRSLTPRIAMRFSDGFVFLLVGIGRSVNASPCSKLSVENMQLLFDFVVAVVSLEINIFHEIFSSYT